MKAVIRKSDVIAAVNQCLLSPGIVDYECLIAMLNSRAVKVYTTHCNGLADAISHAKRQINYKLNRYAHNQKEIAAIFGITPKTLRNWLTLGVIDARKARVKSQDLLHSKCYDGKILISQAKEYLSKYEDFIRNYPFEIIDD